MSPSSPQDEARAVLAQEIGLGLKPDPLLTISEWADRYRVLPKKGSAEPGQWRTSRTPYLREIMDALSPSSRTQTVVFMAGAQVGKTECGNNFLGYIVDYCPAPTMLVQPTVELAKRYSKQRVDPMIQESDRLRDKVRDPRSRDSGNTILSKEFPGGTMIITGANSAVGLRSMPARNLFLDEIDGYPGDADNEGDPVNLAIRRTSTFFRRKILKTSTPKITGQGIDAAFHDEDATQEFYFLPCPHCEHFQRITWKGIEWAEDDPTDVWLNCEECSEKIRNSDKEWMLPRGEWRASNPTASGKVRSFHVSSLYSPVGWFSWEDAVELWRKYQAKKDPALLKTFVNTVLGEGFNEKGEAPEWERLYLRREPYKRNEIPTEKALLLTAGVDVQKDRLEVEIVAWGRGRESWSIDYRIFPGDPMEDGVWQNLDMLLAETWAHPSGVDMRIQKLGVDSGAFTQAVYSWCRQQSPDRVMAMKGQDSQRVVVGHPKAVDVNWQGKVISRGTQVWNIGVSLVKEELYGWLRRDPPTNPEETGWPMGWCHFPDAYDEEYFRQLCGEHMIWKVVKGRRVSQWEATRDRVEGLDCRVYARASATVEGIDRWDDEQWDLVANSLGILNAAPSDQAAPKKKKEGGYFDRWR